MTKFSEKILSKKNYSLLAFCQINRKRSLCIFYIAALISIFCWIVYDSFVFPTQNNFPGELSLLGICLLGYYFLYKKQYVSSVNVLGLVPIPAYYLFMSAQQAILHPGNSLIITIGTFALVMVMVIIHSDKYYQILGYQIITFAAIIVHVVLSDRLPLLFKFYWTDYSSFVNPVFGYVVLSFVAHLIHFSHKRALHDVENKNDSIRKMINNTFLQYPDGIIHFALEEDEVGEKSGMVVTKINSVFEDFFGISPFEAKGKEASVVFQKTFRGEVDWQDIFLNSKAHTHEINIPHLDRWFEVIVIKLSDTEIVGLFRDITERKHSIIELTKSRHRYMLLLETIPDIFFVIDKDGTYIDYVAKEEGIEISADDIIGSTVFEVGFSERMVRQVYHSIQTAIKFDVIETIEYALEVPGRGNCLFEMRMVKLSDVTVMAISRDITKRKLVEQKLAEAKQKAEEADSLKSAFLQNISHEVRTPMNAIMGFSNMLISEDLPRTERSNYLQHIVRNGQLLMQLINDMIKLSRIESGQVEVKKELVGVNNMMIDLHRTFTYEKEQLGKKNIRMNVATGNSNPKFSIYTDGQKVKDVMEILIGNAIKFTHEGEVEFGYRFVGENNIEFFVRDTGIGIPEDKHEEIFDRFHQLDIGLSREYGGTGIGLAVAKDFVGKLDAELKLESALNSGSQFYFAIPIEGGDGFLRVV
jgi:signal transduction histidine kinase